MMCKRPFMRQATGHNKKAILLSTEARLAATPFPCGRCLPCRINKSREWTVRIMLEAMAHQENCFVTLTYDDEHLPNPPDVDKKELKNYVRRLRGGVGKYRYFAVGEYGDQTWRPHYHLALFGIGETHAKQIENAWKKGFVHIGELNKDTARYIVGYVTKKLTNKNDDWTKEKLNGRSPEFSTSSGHGSEGGIGKKGIDRVAKAILGNKYWTKAIVTRLKIAGKELPIGRYLTLKLNKALGFTEEEIKANTYEYSNQQVDEHLKPGVIYYDSIVEEKEQNRKNQKKKRQMYNQKRAL